MNTLQKIKKVASLKKLSYQTVADCFGVVKATVGNWFEKGVGREPDRQAVALFAENYSVPLYWFYDGEDTPVPITRAQYEFIRVPNRLPLCKQGDLNGDRAFEILAKVQGLYSYHDPSWGEGNVSVEPFLQSMYVEVVGAYEPWRYRAWVMTHPLLDILGQGETLIVDITAPITPRQVPVLVYSLDIADFELAILVRDKGKLEFSWKRMRNQEMIPLGRSTRIGALVGVESKPSIDRIVRYNPEGLFVTGDIRYEWLSSQAGRFDISVFE